MGAYCLPTHNIELTALNKSNLHLSHVAMIIDSFGVFPLAISFWHGLCVLR